MAYLPTGVRFQFNGPHTLSLAAYRQGTLSVTLSIVVTPSLWTEGRLDRCRVKNTENQ
ncbi:MAG: hypothetical protein AB1589_16535 [Cyanobacteriota bacterium]